MTGSRPQWYNGMFLLGSFFCCRLLWGTYQSIRVYQDVWAALHYDSLTRSKESGFGQDAVMRFAGDFPMPAWLAGVYLSSNLVLNTLNFYWFGKMIETIQKRFRESTDKKGGRRVGREEGVMVEGLMDSSTFMTEVVDDKAVMDGNGDVGGNNVLEVEQKQIRKRRG